MMMIRWLETVIETKFGAMIVRSVVVSMAQDSNITDFLQDSK